MGKSLLKNGIKELTLTMTYTMTGARMSNTLGNSLSINELRGCAPRSRNSLNINRLRGFKKNLNSKKTLVPIRF